MFAHVQCWVEVGFPEERKNQKKILSLTEPSQDKLVALLRSFLGWGRIYKQVFSHGKFKYPVGTILLSDKAFSLLRKCTTERINQIPFADLLENDEV